MKRSECSDEISMIPYRPSLGIALLFSTIGFGIDRFYVGQIGIGIVLLISYITIFGLVVAVPVEFLSQLSIVMAIFAGRQYAFMYGENVEFAKPSMFDRVIAVLWLLTMLTFVSLVVVGIAMVDRVATSTVTP